MNRTLPQTGSGIPPFVSAALEVALRLFLCSLVLDILYLVTQSGLWAELAFWVMGVGLIVGFIAAPMGIVPDPFRWRDLPRLRRELLDVTALALFCASWLLRRPETEAPARSALAFSWAALACLVASGWLEVHRIPFSRRYSSWIGRIFTFPAREVNRPIGLTSQSYS